MWTPALVRVRYWAMELVLQIGRAEVGEGIAAGVVVVGVLADVGAEVEDGVCADDACVGRRDVESVDFGALIGVADVAEDRVGGWCLR